MFHDILLSFFRLQSSPLRVSGGDQLLLASVGQVERGKVQHVERHANNAKVLQDKVEQVGQVEGQQDGDATQRHLEPSNGRGADETWKKDS